MVPEMGPGHRAGGADLASGVDAAGTVARIDLRVPHHPRLGSPLLRCARFNRSQARAHPASAAARPPPSITRTTRPIYTPPPPPPLSAVFAQAANSARRERPRALQWAACLGTRAARRRGASVTTWCPARALRKWLELRRLPQILLVLVRRTIN